MPNKDIKRFQELLNQAEAGDPEAMFYLATAYKDGTGTEKNLQQFFYWTQKAANTDLPTAMVNLAIAYKDGIGTEKNTQQHFHWIQKAANNNDPEAMFNLAIAYRDGIGTEKNTQQYFHWIQKAANANHPKAMVNLGIAYEDGIGTEKNPQQYFLWTQKAANANDPKAMFNLALAYINGTGTEKNPQQFFLWTQKAANTNNPKAMFNLSLAYKDGTGTEKNTQQYFHWTQKAANTDLPDAMFNLSLAYKDGTGTKKNLQQFFLWIQKAANANHPKAMVNLSLAYKDGIGTEKNPQQYFHWTQKAANTNDPKAMVNLAIAYKDGIGTEKNPQQCFLWIQKAANANDPGAMFNLSLAYKDGTGTEKNPQQHFHWIQKAANAALPEAMFYLATAYKDGVGTEKNTQQFFFWMKKAYNARVSEALIILPISRLLEKEYIEESMHDDIYTALLQLNQACHNILEKNHKVGIDETLSHYTSFEAIDNILKGDKSNYLRLYNIAYFNDPLEGLAFTRALNEEIHGLIYGEEETAPHEIEVENKIFSIYACSFCSHANSLADRLDMWRAYGKNGEGYSITFTIPERLRAKEKFDLHQEIYMQGDIDKRADKSKNEHIRIYKVVYLSKGSKFTDKTYASLTKALEKLKDLLKNKKIKDNDIVVGTVAKIAEQILANLRYLYKDKDYESEEEVRIIRVAEFSDDALEYDDRTPPRLFIRTPNFLFEESGCKITGGPRVPIEDIAAGKNYIRRQLVCNNWKAEVTSSTIKYR